MIRHYIFLISIGLLFAALAFVFLFLPRPTFSELERRELKKAPEFTFARLFDGSYTADLSSWFSDSQPFRDDFMTLSMTVKKGMGITRGSDEEAFVFHQTADIAAEMDPEKKIAAAEAAEAAPESGADPIPEGDISAADGEEAKVAKSGILIVGTGEKVRALMNYAGSESAGGAYIQAVNKYASAMPDVKFYSMVVPIAMEFYCPAEARKKPGLYKSQLPAINYIYTRLAGVRPVNVYTTLSEHAHEDIYLRTDHHWAPLGAYYASRKFAETAGVHVPDLSEFNSNVIHRFVGSMYGFSKDISVKNAPEDFVYYTPRDLDYTATFSIVNLDEKFHITGVGRPYKTSFFKKFRDGSGNAYLTFMGSDYLVVQVKTPVRNGRRLAILKDSYGNAVPGYLFGSFEEVHVLDFRYFPYNMVEYCKVHGITDFLFINNIFNASSAGVAHKMAALLTNKGFTPGTVPAHKPDSAKPQADTAAQPQPGTAAKPKPDTPASPDATNGPSSESPAPTAPAVPENAESDSVKTPTAKDAASAPEI